LLNCGLDILQKVLKNLAIVFCKVTRELTQLAEDKDNIGICENYCMEEVANPLLVFRLIDRLIPHLLSIIPAGYVDQTQKNISCKNKNKTQCSKPYKRNPLPFTLICTPSGDEGPTVFKH
jgi:hypothetical protein